MSLLRLIRGTLVKFDKGYYERITNTHQDFFGEADDAIGEAVEDSSKFQSSAAAYNHSIEGGEVSDRNNSKNNYRLFSYTPPQPSNSYPLLFDILGIGSPSIQDLKRLYEEVQE